MSWQPVPVCAQSSGFRLIVHPQTPVEALTPEEVSRIFLKRVQTWAGGGRVQAVDQAKSSAVRAEFSRLVHGRDVAAIEAMWLRRIFAGTETPPVELASDADVVAFVRNNPGAIGYVSAETPANGVKVVSVEANGEASDRSRRETMDRTEIRRLIAEYETAMEAKDLVALTRLWPSLTDKASTRARIVASFEFAQELEVDLTIVSIDLRGDSASVKCSRRDEIIVARGRPVVHDSETTFRVDRRGVRWVIEEIR